MTLEEHIAYWLEGAENDLVTADAMFEKARYDWALFVGHLVLEKTLKAIYIAHNGKTPPRTHNLVHLAKNTRRSLNDARTRFLGEVNDFNMEARYPDYKYQFRRICTREYALEKLTSLKETYAWLRSQLTQLAS